VLRFGDATYVNLPPGVYVSFHSTEEALAGADGELIPWSLPCGDVSDVREVVGRDGGNGTHRSGPIAVLLSAWAQGQSRSIGGLFSSELDFPARF
jgi:hypothetical protein